MGWIDIRWKAEFVLCAAHLLTAVACSGAADSGGSVSETVSPAPRATAAEVSATPAMPSPTASAAVSPSQVAPTTSASEATVPHFDEGEAWDAVARMLLERTSRDACAQQMIGNYDRDGVRTKAQELADGAGEEPRSLEDDYFLGPQDEAATALGGDELLAIAGSSTAWYLADPTTVADSSDLLLAAVPLREFRLEDGRSVWWRSVDTIAIYPACPKG